MINTSAAYKEAIKKNRILHHEAKIEFSDGTALTPQDQDLYAGVSVCQGLSKRKLL